MSENNIEALDIQIETSLGSDTAKQIGKASRAIKRLADNLSKIDTSSFERLNQLFKGTKEMESYASGIKTVSTAIKGLSKIDQTGLSNAKSTLKEISDMKFDFSQFENLKNIDFSGLSKFGKTLNVAKNNARQTADSLKPIEDRLQIFRGVEPAKTFSEKLGSQKAYTNNMLRMLKQQKDALGFTPTVNMPLKSLDKSNLGYQEYDSKKISKWVDDYSAKIDTAKKKTGELKPAIGSVNPSISKLADSLGKLGSSILGTLGKGFKNVGVWALNLGKKFVTSKLGANNFHNSLNGGFKTFLRYGLGIRSTFVLLNKLRSAFGGAMNNLVRYSSTTNKAISSMWNSLNALRNSLATAFAPVINSVAPYISSLIDMLTDGMNAIAQFFAAITGSKTVVVAKKQNKDYAASLGKIGSSADGSSDKVKDLAESLDLLNFDEINKLSDATSNKGSGGSGGGSGSGGVSGMFETETVDSAFADLADLFKNGKWDEIGDIIADGINGAIGKIDEAIKWDNVGEKITNICTGITSIFNRVVDKMDWSMLGKTVGDGVNTVLYTINLLYDGVDWGNLGSKVATAVNSIFTTVDFDALGAFLVQKFNAVWEFAAGFFDTIDGTQIGNSIGTTLNSAMQHLNLSAARKALSGALNTLADIIGGFNSTVKWDDLTSKLQTNIKGFFTDVKWDKLGEELGTLMGNLVKVLIDIVTDPETIKAMGQAGVDLIGGFFDGLLTALFGDKWTAVKKAFEDVNNWLKDTGNKSVGNMVLSGITFDFEMNDETRKNFAGFIGKINNESVELRVDTKLLQSGDDAWKEYAEKWNKEKPELKIPDSVINGGKETIIKWLSDAYKENPDLIVDVDTDKTGSEVARETVDDFEKEATRKGGAHFSAESRQPGKKIADEVITDFNKNTSFGVLGVQTNKSGEQFRQDLANGFNSSKIGFNVDVQGKLKNQLDTSQLGTPVVNATAKATSADMGGIPSSNKSIWNAKAFASAADMGGIPSSNKSIWNAKAFASAASMGGIPNDDKNIRSAKAYANSAIMVGIPEKDKHVSGVVAQASSLDVKKGISAKGKYTVTSNVDKTTSGKTITAEGNFNVKKVSIASRLKSFFGMKEKGGVFSGGSWSNLPQFSSGGMISQTKIGRFAGGGLPGHGTAFVAGENGAEIVGNVNGRTEVLNQSQIASAIYAAVIQAMKQQNVNVNVSLQGDANTMFKVVQNKARQYTVQTGKMPFAY